MVEFRDLDGSYFRVRRNGKWQSISLNLKIREAEEELLIIEEEYERITNGGRK